MGITALQRQFGEFMVRMKKWRDRLRSIVPILAFTVVANVVVWMWSNDTLALHPEASRASITKPPTVEARKAALDVVLKEKEFRVSEAAAHAERLQAGVLFYMSVIVVGVITAAWKKDAPDWRELRRKPVTAFLVLLFLLANINMGTQAMALSLDAVANAKFVAVYLNPQIAALSEWPIEKAPWGDKIHDVLFWDQWWADSKQLFTAVRDRASEAWMAVVAVVSFVALVLFEPRSLDGVARWLAMTGLLVVAVFAGWLAHAVFLYRFLGANFGRRYVDAPTFHLETAIVTTLMILLGWLVIITARKDASVSEA